MPTEPILPLNMLPRAQRVKAFPAVTRRPRHGGSRWWPGSTPRQAICGAVVSVSASSVVANRTAQRGPRVRERGLERRQNGPSRFTEREHMGGIPARALRRLLGPNGWGAPCRPPPAGMRETGIPQDAGLHLAVAPLKGIEPATRRLATDGTAR